MRDLLAAWKWKETDEETLAVMLKASRREEPGWFDNESINNFPCTDLRTIDRLWVKYSNGRFGFSVQKKIYLGVGGKADGKYYEEAWDRFSDRVGWRVKGNWIDYEDVAFKTSAHEGYIPLPFLSREKKKYNLLIGFPSKDRFDLSASWRQCLCLFSHQDL